MYTEASRYFSDTNPVYTITPNRMPMASARAFGTANGSGPPRRRQMSTALQSTTAAIPNRQNSNDAGPSAPTRSFPTTEESEYDSAVAPAHSAPTPARVPSDPTPAP